MGWAEVLQTVLGSGLKAATNPGDHVGGDDRGPKPIFDSLDLEHDVPLTEGAGMPPFAESAEPMPNVNPAIASATLPPAFPGPRQRSLPRVNLESALDKYYQTSKADPPKLSRGRAALSGLALVGQDMPSIMNSRNVDDNSAFGMAVGDALSRVIGGLIAPGATAMQVKQARENKALQDVGTAQQLYDLDVRNRQREQAIELSDAQEEKAREWADIEKYKVVSKNLAPLLGLYNKSSKWVSKDNQAINDQISEILGRPLELPDKSPNVKTTFRYDAKSHRIMAVGVDPITGEVVSNKWILDPTTKGPAEFTSEREAAALIQALQSDTNSKRTYDIQIRKIKQSAEQFTKKVEIEMAKLDVAKKKAITTSVDKNMETWEQSLDTIQQLNSMPEARKEALRAAKRASFLRDAAKQFGIDVPIEPVADEGEEE